MSTCVMLKVGDGKVCGKPAPKVFEGKTCCTIHYNVADRAKKEAEEKANPKPKAAPVKPAAKPAAKPATKAVAAKAPQKAASTEEEEESTVVAAGIPVASKNGTCDAQKAKGGACGKTASYTCPDSCHCNGEPMCKTHWKKVHPEIMNSSGTKAGGRKEVPDEERCEHELSSAAKKGQRCANRAYGTVGDLRSCHIHGGPKKDTVVGAGSSAGGSNSAAPAGPFKECDLITVMSSIIDFISTHDENDCEQGCDTTTGLPCPQSVAIAWVRDLFKLYAGKVPSLEESMDHFSKADQVTGQDQEFSVIFEHCMLYYLRELLGDNNMSWLYTLFSKYSRQSGQDGATIAAIWKASADELEIKTAIFDPPAPAPVEGAAIVSSKKRQNMSAILKAASAEAEKPAEEVVEEEQVEATEPMEVDEEAPVTLDLDGLDA